MKIKTIKENHINTLVIDRQLGNKIQVCYIPKYKLTKELENKVGKYLEGELQGLNFVEGESFFSIVRVSKEDFKKYDFEGGEFTKENCLSLYKTYSTYKDLGNGYHLIGELF